MKSGTFGLALAGAALLAGLIVIIAVVHQSSKLGFRSAIQPGDPDAVLGLDHRNLTMPMSKTDDFLFKETVCYSDGSPRIVKTVYDKRLARRVDGNVPEVMYEYYRQDGTLERDLLISAEAGLGGGVYCKDRKRTFDTDGKTQLREQYIREDGTLGVDIDMVKDIFKEYRSDGKTLRFVQERHPNGKTRQTKYRLDGKTVWWVNEDTTKVFFDRKGNQVSKQFSWHVVATLNPTEHGGPSVPCCEHRYVRADGTAEYTQTWHDLYDNDLRVKGLAQVDVFATDGKTLLARIHLRPQHIDKVRFITRVELWNADGSRLVRNYRSPGCRLDEELFDASGKSIKKETFPSGDSFSEAFPDIIFQGFGGLNHSGEYDIDRYDI